MNADMFFIILHLFAFQMHNNLSLNMPLKVGISDEKWCKTIYNSKTYAFNKYILRNWIEYMYIQYLSLYLYYIKNIL